MTREQPRVTASVDGSHISITVDLPGFGPYKLNGDTWKAIARGVLKQYNAAEYRLDPAELVTKIREGLADAALRGLEPEQKDLARRRMVSTVLHRLADMIQAGTVDEFEGSWLTDEPDAIELDVVSKHGKTTTIKLALGRGIVAPEAA